MQKKLLLEQVIYKMYEVVEYRNCFCKMEDCPGEKEIILFQHKDKPPCIYFMFKKGTELRITKIRHYTNDKNKIDIYSLFRGREIRRRLRVQKWKK